MKKLDIFQVLLEFQCEVNLPSWLKHAKIHDNKIVSKHGIPLEEGVDENPHIKGFLVFENGATLVDRLRENGIVKDTIIPPWEYISDKNGFLKYLSSSASGKKKSRESAYVYDSSNSRITRVREFNNDIMDDIIYKEYLPRCFLSQERDIDVDDPDEGIGLKTRNGIRLALFYPEARSFQIKATPFGNAGMGIVAEYGPGGLVRTAHIEHRPKGNLSYINEDFKVTLIYTEFKRENGEVMPSSEKVLKISDLLEYKTHLQAA